MSNTLPHFLTKTLPPFLAWNLRVIAGLDKNTLVLGQNIKTVWSRVGAFSQWDREKPLTILGTSQGITSMHRPMQNVCTIMPGHLLTTI